MYRTAGTAFIDCDYNKQQPYTVYCWCWPNVYSSMCIIMSTVNSTYCYTVRYQNNKPPHTYHALPQPTTTLYNIHLYWRELKGNFNYILFTVRWQPTFPLLLLTHQHTDCCSLHKQHNNCVTITWSQALCAAVVWNTSISAKLLL